MEATLSMQGVTMKRLYILFCFVFGVSLAQTVTVDPMGAVTVVEGNNLTITCTCADGVNAGADIFLRENGIQLPAGDDSPNEVNSTVRIFRLPVDRTDNGNTYDCLQVNTAVNSSQIHLIVHYPPEYANTPSLQFTQLMVGASFTLNCTPSAANPPVNTVSIAIDGSPVTSGDTVTVTDNVLTIPSVQRSHSGNYSCNATNTRGSAVIFDNLVLVVPPNITMQPVPVTPDETTTRCCAGVRVFLEDPSDPTLVFTAQVSTEGSPFTARPVTREGDVVYVQGLQAGTPYNIRLTGRNNFGSVTKEVSTTPLIGSPSDPSMPVVSVEGSSVSIQLSTRYPGTNARGQFRFSLIFSAASTAKRQSLQPTEVRVDPTGLDSSVTTTHTLTDVTAGSYSVSVMAENENGMSQEITATFVVEEPVHAPADSATVIAIGITAVVVVVVIVPLPFILILLPADVVGLMLKRKRKREVRRISAHRRNVNVEFPGSHFHTEAVRLEPNPAYETVPSTFANDPQYEECRGGVTRCGHVSIEENPAYQPLNAICTPKMKDGPTYQNVRVASF